jgi:hypothetical protein
MPIFYNTVAFFLTSPETTGKKYPGDTGRGFRKGDFHFSRVQGRWGNKSLPIFITRRERRLGGRIRIFEKRFENWSTSFIFKAAYWSSTRRREMIRVAGNWKICSNERSGGVTISYLCTSKNLLCSAQCTFVWFFKLKAAAHVWNSSAYPFTLCSQLPKDPRGSLLLPSTLSVTFKKSVFIILPLHAITLHSN